MSIPYGADQTMISPPTFSNGIGGPCRIALDHIAEIKVLIVPVT